MGYEPYVTSEEYNGEIIPETARTKYLRQASRHIDSLTFNRIVARGFRHLTQFQQEIIKECTVAQAEFEYENEELIQTYLQSYSVNGVSMTFGNSWNLMVQNGVAIRKDVYELLSQTGLCRLVV